MSKFNDREEVTVVLTIDRGALEALKDHPALLQPQGEGNHFINACVRGVKALHRAEEVDRNDYGFGPRCTCHVMHASDCFLRAHE